MPRMGKTEEDWKGLKLGFLKTVQRNSFSKLIPADWNFRHIYLSRISDLSFTCNFFAYFKFHSDWGRVIGKIQQNELDCRDTAPSMAPINGITDAANESLLDKDNRLIIQAK